jgi:hypothetical protein
MGENWTSLKLPFAENVWSQQNTLKQQVEMLNGSNITLLGTEAIDGVDCYKIKADINTAALAAQLSSTSSPLPMQFVNYSQLFDDALLEAYYWITMDTNLLKRSDIFESFVIRPQELGIEPKGPENVEMRVYANISMAYGGFNDIINIELPEGAGMAEALPVNITSTPSGEALLPAASAENSTQAIM